MGDAAMNFSGYQNTPIALGLAVIAILCFSYAGIGWIKDYWGDEEKLPGISFHTVIKILDVGAIRRKYFFQCQSPDGTQASFYMTASNRFAFSITDHRHETYTIDAPLGKNGIPIGKYIYLVCEAASASSSSFMRILVDRAEIERRDFQFPIDMGSRNWQLTVGADAKGENNAAFRVAEILICSVSLTNRELKKFHGDLRKRVFAKLA